MPRIPLSAEGLQVNFCKNPRCANFGIPALPVNKRGRGAGLRDNYKIDDGTTGSRGSVASKLLCKLCGSKPALKSNLAITQEINRAARLSRPGNGAELPECWLRGTSARHLRFAILVPAVRPDPSRLAALSVQGMPQDLCCRRPDNAPEEAP
ncbi:hypothetical protein [Paraburkholderia sp. RL17-347-BIC-D]|uniref:hypothetical protein n=1 Tax=Paraburkholderia sp. RL17-347-BIC-D TaxID=3031632 RepID=UPI0038BD9CD5